MAVGPAYAVEMPTLDEARPELPYDGPCPEGGPFDLTEPRVAVAVESLAVEFVGPFYRRDIVSEVRPAAALPYNLVQ